MTVQTRDKKVNGYVLWYIHNYPETKQKLKEYQSGTAPRIYVNSLYMQRMEQTVGAIEKVLQHIDPLQAKMVELVYWKKTHNALVRFGWRRHAFLQRNSIFCAAVTHGYS